MPVLKTTSAATSTSAPNASPTKTEPSSRARAASLTVLSPRQSAACTPGQSQAVPVHDAAVGNGHQHCPAQRLTTQRRVLALGQEALRIHHPGLIRIEHHDVGRRAWLQRAVRQAPGTCRTVGQRPNQLRQTQGATVYQAHEQAEGSFEPGNARLGLVELARLVDPASW